MTTPPRVPSIEELHEAGVLSALDLHFALTMGRLAGTDEHLVLLGAAMASRHTGKRHVCVDLPRLVDDRRVVGDDGEIVKEFCWPGRDEWLSVLSDSDLVHGGSGMTPLVLDAAGRLYLRRYWQHQQRLVEAIQARVHSFQEDLDDDVVREVLDRLFEGGREAPGYLQKIAALVAVVRKFCVITGGPGTGKTFTVVKILALLVEHALRTGSEVPSITLLAPTGKAAARLEETIKGIKASADPKKNLECSGEVKEKIPEEASTIHRCLSPYGESKTRFRHNRDNRLPADVVIVDEASMVDLGLMTRLVDAIRDDARLILLGDRNQLASVEAGAILGDICNVEGTKGFSTPFSSKMEEDLGVRMPLGEDPPDDPGIWDCIVHLNHSWRYREGSGIGILADAINEGRAAEALRILESADYPDVVLHAHPASGKLPRAFDETVAQGYRAYLEEKDHVGKIDAFGRFRILCALRKGPHGMETINRRIEERLVRGRSRSTWYAGQPVLVTVNDYQLRLFNGDIGLILRKGDGLRACFIGPDGKERSFAPARIPPHETTFAMTIHKSQGSEFDRVAVLLPARDTPLLTRELLYTAVSRARDEVVIFGTREIIEEAVKERIERASGLADALWEPE